MFDYQKLKKIREHFGLSENKFAKSIHVSQSTYYRIERGDAKIDADALSEIFAVYKVNPNWLFFGEGGDNPVFMENHNSEISSSQIIKLQNENLTMANELKELYKELAEERKVQTVRLKNIDLVPPEQ